ncbi:hypothetical protein [Nostoc sp.]|uniref:hypothetical protein n=1 Tax=Nostoc sp. TaxID=1180 RepID=UPI002FFC894E
MINSVHLSGLSLSALNLSSGRDVSLRDSFTLTKMRVEDFPTCVYTVAFLRGASAVLGSPQVERLAWVRGNLNAVRQL